ncbi:MAG: hypothetical protein KJ069_14700 [Anaerolineae bacterium]|nr:hypothetical protein [Anaerolineae bacterium]
MPTTPLRSTTPAIDVYVKLAQYPILSDRIRLRMREELFQRGIISKTIFEQEVKNLAIESQRREGLSNPLYQEDESAWQRRLEAIRDYHTDALFANNLGISLLEQIVEDILRNQHVSTNKTELTFNPEVAPWALLFQQGGNYDALPPPQQEKIKHHLEEIKVVLIKRLMSDQLPFIAVAKNVFTIQDLRWVYERLIGRGKIGGKASGMVLAWKILQLNRAELGPDLRPFVHVPDTFFVGSELIYEFLYLNKLERFVNQKYLPDAERQAQYPKIVAACMAGELPDFLVDHLREVLVQFHGRPFIVRSSSLLEDHLDYAFAGKYATVFCPNQATPDENLADLLNAIRRIYASTFDPNAMSAREKYGLIDYDERMAIMIQPLVGERHGRYFFPTIVGAGWSKNPFHQQTGGRKEDGCLRLIWGFADRINSEEGAQQSCIIALNPTRAQPDTPDSSLAEVNQQTIKVVNLETNQFEHIPITNLLDDMGMSRDNNMVTAVITPDGPAPAITFKALTQDTRFIKLMRHALNRLQTIYDKPVELEFTLLLKDAPTGPRYHLYILQCHTGQSVIGNR